jgi:hypothetical protein
VSPGSHLLRLAFALSLTGCSTEPLPPTAAALNLQFATPAGDDGAVLLTIAGGPVDSVEAPGFLLHLDRREAGITRVIVLGDIKSGRLARIHVPDERQTSRYTAVINQVAARRSYAQRDPAAYVLNLTP